MMTAGEMTGIKTGERIEFNPQQDLFGKIVSRSWSAPRHREHGEWLNKRFMRTV
jgi:hypothetical protein